MAEEAPAVGASGPEQLALFGRPIGAAADGDSMRSGERRLSDAATAYLVLLGSIKRSAHSI